MGNSLEMSCLLVSLLRGFGFTAYVVVGWVDKKTAQADTTAEKCPLLRQEEEEEKEAGRRYEGAYRLRRPLDLTSRYQQFLYKNRNSGGGGGGGEDGQEAREDQEDTEIFHGWVYVETANTAFFVESTTGARHPISAAASYIRINCLFNDLNYWTNLQKVEVRGGATLRLAEVSRWFKLVGDVKKKDEPEKKNAAKSLAPFGMTAKKQVKPAEKEEILKRPFDVIYSWVTTLSIPIDSYELLYRLGQKHDEFFATKVEYYAPYLLKDGMVQRIRHFADDSPGILARSSAIFCDVFLY